MQKLLELENWQENRIIRRINRFVVEVEAEGGVRRAHINNTGRLEELLIEERKAYTFLTPHTTLTDRRLFAVSEGDYGALIDTQLQMRAFERALELDRLPWLTGCRFLKRNARLGDSLIDYLIECEEGDVFLEVKSAVLRVGEFASYPDCPSTRGQKHVRELTEYIRKGGKAIILFMAALPGVRAFRPYPEGDPILADLLAQAKTAGVDVRAVSLAFVPGDSAICLLNPDLPISLTV